MKRNTRKDVIDSSKSKKQKQRYADREILSKVWEHFCSFLDSKEENDEGPDFDYLHEIIQDLQQFDIPVLLKDVSEENIINMAGENLVNLVFPDLPSLLPVLMSVTYLHLADEAMSALSISNDDVTANTPDSLLYKSLTYFPFNAAALYTLANYQQMMSIHSPQEICAKYEHASRFGHEIRTIAMNHLQGTNDDDDQKEESELSEWIDGLLLHEIAGARSFDNDINDVNSEENIEEDEFPVSSIEASSLFMAAFLRSSLQEHDLALKHLQKLDLTHRIHPNVWKASSGQLLTNEDNLGDISTVSDDDILFVPQIYSGQVISNDMHNKLLQVFSREAPFWKESDYHHRSYFSFFEDMTEESFVQPRHLIDDLVLNHLLPLATSLTKEKIVGYEFWAHSRPLSANLGHQLHFDTDESLLNQNKKITHPIVSSVLYLSGCNGDSETSAGPTVIFNQTPDSSHVATKAWISKPKEDGLYLMFPGNLLHGVLPCRCKDSDRGTSEPMERLTLMIGFWTRRVPDTMKERRLYGPCSPIPPNDDDHTWVRQIMEGYPRKCDTDKTRSVSNAKSSNVPCVSPAWEQIHRNEDALQVNVPFGVDHKYFVKNAPSCFRECLFPRTLDADE